MTLYQLQESFDVLFGERDRLFFPSPTDLTGLLSIRIGDLQDLMRKLGEEPQPAYAKALRRLVVCVFGVANFYRLDMARFMAAKYPESGCGYCHNIPCICSETERQEHSFLQSRDQDRNVPRLWSLDRWCEHLQQMYGGRAENSSPSIVVLRMFRELSELNAAIAGARTSSKSNREILGEIGNELADLLAWIIAMANLQQVHLGESVWDHYRLGCHRCEHSTCTCKPIHIEPEQWVAVERREGSTR